MKSVKGFALVEVLVALGLVVLIGFALSVGIHQFRLLVSQAQLTLALDRQIHDIVENVRPNINLFQIDYTQDESQRLATLDPANLPMAWDIGIIALAQDCSICSGRFGYVIHPLPVWPGIFKLTLRVTHRTWSTYRDYSFLVTSK